MNLDDDAHRWLDRFAELVRSRDTAAAEPMFHPDCTAFGTRAAHLDSRDQLVAEQWMPIWTSTEGFHFLEEGRSVSTAEDGSLVVVTARWASVGIAADERRFPRAGRATIVLEPSATSGSEDPTGRAVGEGALVARHSHFSELPAPPVPPADEG